MRRPVVAGVAAAAALGLYPAPASAARLTGVVVGASAAKHTLAVASPHGAVRTVHAGRTAAVGARVTALCRRLPDGSYRATSISVRGSAARARIRGTVVAATAGTLVLSAGGARIEIQRGRVTAGVGSSAGPQPGDVVDATVSIEDDGTLDEFEVQDQTEPAGSETPEQTSPPSPAATAPAPPAPQAGGDDQGETQDAQQAGSDDGQEAQDAQQSDPTGGSVSEDGGSGGGDD